MIVAIVVMEILVLPSLLRLLHSSPCQRRLLVCVYTYHLRQKHRTLQSPLYATSNIPRSSGRGLLRLASFLSGPPTDLFNENPVPSLLHPRMDYWTLLPLGCVFGGDTPAGGCLTSFSIS